MPPTRFRLSLLPALLLSLLLAALSTPVAAQDDDGALSLNEYWALVADTQRLVQAAEDGDEAARRALAPMARQWRAAQRITTPAGDQIAVDHSHIVSQLSAGDPDFGRLRARLDALQALSRRWPDATLADAGAAPALAELDEVLRDPQFQWPEEEPSLQEMLWDYVLRFLRRLLPESLEASPVVGRVMTGLALLFLLGVLLYAARTLLASFSPATRAAPAGPTGQTLTADTALQEAQALSRSGNYRTAVRYLYLSTLLLLDERGLLRYDRTRTNGEYLDSVAQRPDLAATLENVIDVFDRVWYGYQPLDSDTYAWYEAQVRELQNRQ